MSRSLDPRFLLASLRASWTSADKKPGISAHYSNRAIYTGFSDRFWQSGWCSKQGGKQLLINVFFDNKVRYVTNATGEATDVLVPIELWQQLIHALRDPESGLAWVDEHEPNAQILADLQVSLQHAAVGATFPISQLWDDIEAQ